MWILTSKCLPVLASASANLQPSQPEARAPADHHHHQDRHYRRYPIQLPSLQIYRHSLDAQRSAQSVSEYREARHRLYCVRPPLRATRSGRQPPIYTHTMAERNLAQIVNQLKQSPSLSYPEANKLLSKAKLALLNLKALTPSPDVPQNLLVLARETYEQGALFAIRARNPEAFTRYVNQLQPFYQLPSSRLPLNLAERNKVTGLSLLLLLTQGRYGEFHSELESLANGEGGGGDVEGDRYLGYPIRLERWLMEGSYDRVWKAMKSSEVPCDEYSVFSEVSWIGWALPRSLPWLHDSANHRCMLTRA